MRLKNISFIFLSIIAGCVLYQDPVVPPIHYPHHFKVTVITKHPHLKNHWWENFHDNQLNQLVNLSIQNNYNYLIAIKNIDIAKTYVTQYESSLFPQINLSYQVSRNKSISSQTGGLSTNVLTGQKSSRLFNLNNLTGSVSYELDVWHQLANTVNQAKALVDASDADSRVVKLILISNVVKTYFQIKTLHANINNLLNQQRIAQNILQLNTAQYQGGLIDVSVLDMAKNQVETIRLNLTSLQNQQQTLMTMLAYLVGEFPENFKVKINDQMPYHFQQLIPSQLPAMMIANRPDIQEAYYTVIAYGYLEKQNIANFLPAFNITGSYGYASSALSHLISAPNAVWSYGLNALQPVLDFGLRKSEYDRSKLQFDSAILNYKNTVITAFQQVDAALGAYQEDHKGLLVQLQDYTNSIHIVNVYYAQYKSGYGDALTYLANKLNLLQSEYILTNQKFAVTEDIIQFYQTIGLGLT